jgi:hypothetical protein
MDEQQKEVLKNVADAMQALNRRISIQQMISSILLGILISEAKVSDPEFRDKISLMLDRIQDRETSDSLTHEAIEAVRAMID